MRSFHLFLLGYFRRSESHIFTQQTVYHDYDIEQVTDSNYLVQLFVIAAKTGMLIEF